MNKTLDTLRQELSSLPHEQRQEMVDFLCDSLTEDETGQAVLRGNDDTELEAVLLRRINEIESGQVQPISSEQVFADLNRAYP